jgi:hypothetical protein
MAACSVVRTRGNDSAPADDRRNARAALEEIALLNGKRPVVREPLAAVVAGEDDERIALAAGSLERLQHASDARIHVAHHRREDLRRSALHHRPRPVILVADRFILGALPWRMRAV